MKYGVVAFVNAEYCFDVHVSFLFEGSNMATLLDYLSEEHLPHEWSVRYKKFGLMHDRCLVALYDVSSGEKWIGNENIPSQYRNVPLR